MVAHAGSRRMRGRLAPPVLLALVALSPGLLAPTAAAMPWGNSVHDACIDPGAVPWYPTAIVVFSGECTQVGAQVAVMQRPDTIVIAVTVHAADHHVDFVLECTDPRHLPRPGIPGRGHTEWYAPCWSHDAWLA